VNKVYSAYLNEEPVKKFEISENESIETVYKNFTEYGIKKLSGHVDYFYDESIEVGKFYLSNGVDKLFLKEEK